MNTTAVSTDWAVEVRDLEVTFGTFRALKGADLAVRRGEIVGLLGENGAGKSTLIKVLSGVYRPSAGTVLLHGTPTRFHSPREAIEAGIATVHQHSMLAENLTVAANLLLGEEPGTPGAPWLVLNRELRRKAQEIVDRVGIDIPLDRQVAELSLAMKQRVEIVRAAAQASTLLILDEPTAALDGHEVDELFQVMRHLRDQGIPVLYISHRLSEIPQICDRVVVLRDGMNAGALPAGECQPDNIIPLLAGREIGELFPDVPSPAEEIVLSVRDVVVGNNAPFNLDLRRSEIVALTGAAGAGQREVARAIAGIEARRGTVTLEGNVVAPHDVPVAIARGIVYVSGDRSEGIFGVLPVWRNAALGLWPVLTNALGFISGRREKKEGRRLSEKFKVRAASLDQPIETLSGGNQQKALIARWAAVKPRLLILDEPTLGVDVGARREIYDLIAEEVAEGTSILLVSADHAELQSMSHRVLVFAAGQVTAEFPSHEATEEAILAARLMAEHPIGELK